MKVIQAVKFVIVRTYEAVGSLLIIYIVLSSLVSISSIVNIFIFKKIIDAAGGQQSFFGLTLLGLIIFRLAYEIFNSLLSNLANYIWSVVDVKQTIYNTSAFVKKLATLDLSNLEDSRTYDKVWRSFNRIPWQIKFYLEGFILLLGRSIEMSASIVIFAINSPLGALLIVVANIVPIVMKAFIGELSFNIYKDNSEDKRKFEYSASLATNRDILVEVKLFQGFGFIREKLLSIYNNFATKQLRLFKKAWIVYSIVDLLPVIAIFGYLFILVFQLQNHLITIGSFVFLFTNIFIFSSALNGVSRYLTSLLADAHFIHDAIDYYNIKQNIIYPSLGTSALTTMERKLQKPTITVENVSFRYPNSQRMVLENINLTIPYGQNFALIGENGAGKTTLVKLLLRVYDPSEGRILINGTDLKKIPESLMFQTYSCLFQMFGKFYLTIRENMELATGKKLTDEEYISALKLSNAWRFVEKFPKKLDQQLGPTYSDGVDLSGGQWQQLAIGRALARKTPILILDEPTSSVDAKSEMEIFDRLNKETKDSTVIFISHRFSTIKDAQRIVVIDRGKIIEDGNHDSLMKDKGKYAKLFNLQAERYVRE